MFCDEVLEAIEPIAAGDVTPDTRIAVHLDSCARCRAALGRAREIERLLQERPVPAAPPHFTSRALARIRHDWWRSDQVVDAAFNAILAVVFLAAFVAVWIVMSSAGLDVGALSAEVLELLRVEGVAIAHRIGPVAPVYAAATLLLGGTIAIWWWAERV